MLDGCVIMADERENAKSPGESKSDTVIPSHWSDQFHEKKSDDDAVANPRNVVWKKYIFRKILVFIFGVIGMVIGENCGHLLVGGFAGITAGIIFAYLLLGKPVYPFSKIDKNDNQTKTEK